MLHLGHVPDNIVRRSQAPRAVEPKLGHQRFPPCGAHAGVDPRKVPALFPSELLLGTLELTLTLQQLFFGQGFVLNRLPIQSEL